MSLSDESAIDVDGVIVSLELAERIPFNDELTGRHQDVGRRIFDIAPYVLGDVVLSLDHRVHAWRPDVGESRIAHDQAGAFGANATELRMIEI